MTRLDAALAARGFARSRTAAARAIADGLVTVDGKPVVKPSAQVADDAEIALAAADHYVSRGAHKLIAALDAFHVDPAGRLALDLGASTGGFTQVLLERGAVRVLAIDVGHGQLDPRLALDSRVTSIEGVNARFLTAEALAGLAGTVEGPEFIVGDLSFISLTQVLPAIAATMSHDSDIVLLVKPQFEVGRTAVRGGLVTDPALRSDAVMDVLWAAWDLGLRCGGVIASPLAGTHGNAEYLVSLSAQRGADPSEWMDRVHAITGGR